MNEQVKQVLTGLLNDPNPVLANRARLAIRRIDLVDEFGKRIHVMTLNNELIGDINTGTPVTPLPEGTAIRVLRWHVPSPTGEEGPRGGVQIYDYVQVISTGQTGFVPRFGFEQLTFI
jgi:hypothetical protein